MSREPGLATQSGVARGTLDPQMLNALLRVMTG